MDTFRFAIPGLIIRLMIFLILSATTAILLFQKVWIIAAPVFLFLVISAWNIIYFVNSVNRKLSYFFDSVRNEDMSLHYSEKVKPASLKALHKSMNAVNSLISEFNIRHEHREKFFWGMISGSATGHMAIDETGNIEMINSAALRYAGLSHIAHVNLLKQKNKPLYDVLEQVKPGQVRMLRTLDGEELRHLSVKVSHLKYSNKHYRLYSIYDIRPELEENELDSWQKLIRVLTHEIMNSIAPITSMSNTLKRFYIKDNTPVTREEIDQGTVKKTLQGLEVIEQQGAGLINFVEAYRELTKIPKPVFKPIHVYEFLSRLELFLKNRLNEEGIELTVERKDQEMEIVGDEKLLSRVIINLVTNAIEALRSSEKKVIRIAVIKNINGRLVITVTDSGHGISADNIDKIFVPFFTTKENGSGIGLSLSRQIMRLHKGSISVQSKPGKETVFSLVF